MVDAASKSNGSSGPKFDPTQFDSTPPSVSRANGEDLSADTATPKQIKPDEDLSAGEVSPGRRALDSIALQELNHRLALQQSAFSIAVALAFILFIAAIVFAGAVLYTFGDRDAHWHSSLLAGAFVIPPTVIVLALLRAVYSSKSDAKSDDSVVPVVNFLKEVVAAFKGTIKG